MVFHLSCERVKRRLSCSHSSNPCGKRRGEGVLDTEKRKRSKEKYRLGASFPLGKGTPPHSRGGEKKNRRKGSNLELFVMFPLYVLTRGENRTPEAGCKKKRKKRRSKTWGSLRKEGGRKGKPPWPFSPLICVSPERRRALGAYAFEREVVKEGGGEEGSREEDTPGRKIAWCSQNKEDKISWGEELGKKRTASCHIDVERTSVISGRKRGQLTG